MYFAKVSSPFSLGKLLDIHVHIFSYFCDISDFRQMCI